MLNVECCRDTLRGPDSAELLQNRFDGFCFNDHKTAPIQGDKEPLAVFGLSVTCGAEGDLQPAFQDQGQWSSPVVSNRALDSFDGHRNILKRSPLVGNNFNQILQRSVSMRVAADDLSLDFFGVAL